MCVCVCVTGTNIKIESLFVSDSLCESGIEHMWVSTGDSLRFRVCQRDLLSDFFFVQGLDVDVRVCVYVTEGLICVGVRFPACVCVIVRERGMLLQVGVKTFEDVRVLPGFSCWLCVLHACVRVAEDP